MRNTRLVVALAVGLFALAAALTVVLRAPSSLPAALTVEAWPSPAASGSGQPSLATSMSGEVFLSWLQRRNEALVAFQYASLTDGRWSEPATIVEGANLFANWADVPSLHALADGRLAAHWLFRSGDDVAGYQVGVKISDSARVAWSDLVVPHDDASPVQHGFVSLFDWPDGDLGVVWLDGRQVTMAADGDTVIEGAMALRSARIAADRTVSDERVVDARTCDCCPTAALTVGHSVIVAYRDRTAGEVRDISAVRLEDGVWTSPVPVHADGWTIGGCPVNGPALAAEGDRVVIAWFSAADGSPRVSAAFSADRGRTWSDPVPVADGPAVLGRPAVATRTDGSAIVAWLEQEEAGAALRARSVAAEGGPGAPVTVASGLSSRASGFARLVRHVDDVLVAWTETGTPSRVRLARVR